MTLLTCISIECRTAREKPFEVDKPNQACPKCGYSNTLRVVSTIHLLIRDPKGTIPGYDGSYRVACGIPFTQVRHGTGDAVAANCPKCLEICPPQPVQQENEPPVSATPTPPLEETD